MQPEYEAIARSSRKKPLWTLGPATREVTHGRAAIEHLVRHRDPFLFVDHVTALDLDQRAARGRRRIAADDPVFVGHFPGAPLYPGVLQLETMGQLGLCLMYFVGAQTTEVAPTAEPRDVRALKIHHAQFLAEVLPGDVLDILATVIDHDDYTAVCAGQLMRGETVLSTAIMEVYLVES